MENLILNKYFLSGIIENDWAYALEPVRMYIKQIGKFLRKEISSGKGYLPRGSNIMKAFTFPFNQVKVIIVGQDPYPTPGHASGLSFSVTPKVNPIPRTLSNIFVEYTKDLGYPQPSNGDLTTWAEQGVLLLNRVLTVSPGMPNSHRDKGWEFITDHAIRVLVDQKRPITAILWGHHASSLSNMLRKRGCEVVESPHPSPLSASKGFFGSKPFSRINKLLKQKNLKEINWKLV